MEGLIKCSVVPPRRLYRHVLPYTTTINYCFVYVGHAFSNGTYPENVDNLRDEERALTGTWDLDEVRLAVEKDYKTLDIYEVYEYQVTQYKRKTNEGGLFVDYINTFLKTKAEESGYSSWFRNPEEEE
jgi:hypothetical protein